MANLLNKAAYKIIVQLEAIVLCETNYSFLCNVRG
jgi:hypothetical protein